MNTGKLSFSNTPIQGERLPVEDIQQMNKVLDEKYKINEAHLDSVENTLNTIKVDERNNDILAERKDATLTAIRDLRNSGNLENAARNVKGIVSNLANDELFQAAIYDKQLLDKADADLDEAYKNQLKNGKGGITAEQVQYAKLMNKVYNGKALTKDKTGTVINYFKGVSVPEYQDYKGKILERLSKLKPDMREYQTLGNKIISSGDIQAQEAWKRIQKSTQAGGGIDLSHFEGVGVETLINLAASTMKDDQIDAYIDFMSKGATLQKFVQVDETGRIVRDSEGNAMYKRHMPSDTGDLFKNAGVEYRNINGEHQLGKYNVVSKLRVNKLNKPILDKNGKNIYDEVKEFEVNKVLTGTIFDAKALNGVNDSAIMEMYNMFNKQSYIQDGKEFASNYSYANMKKSHITDAIAAFNRKAGLLAGYLDTPPEPPKAINVNTPIYLTDKHENMPSYFTGDLYGNNPFVTEAAVELAAKDPNDLEYKLNHGQIDLRSYNEIRNKLGLPGKDIKGNTLGISNKTTPFDYSNKVASITPDANLSTPKGYNWGNLNTPANTELMINHRINDPASLENWIVRKMTKDGNSGDAIKYVKGLMTGSNPKWQVEYPILYKQFAAERKKSDGLTYSVQTLDRQSEQDLLDRIGIKHSVTGSESNKKDLYTWNNVPYGVKYGADGKPLDGGRLDNPSNLGGNAEEDYKKYNGATTIVDPVSGAIMRDKNGVLRQSIRTTADDGGFRLIMDENVSNIALSNNIALAASNNAKIPLPEIQAATVNTIPSVEEMLQAAQNPTTFVPMEVVYPVMERNHKVQSYPALAVKGVDGNIYMYKQTIGKDNKPTLQKPIIVDNNYFNETVKDLSVLGNMGNRANKTRNGSNFISTDEKIVKMFNMVDFEGTSETNTSINGTPDYSETTFDNKVD